MKPQTIDRRLVTILLIVFVQMLGASMVLPILPLYAQEQFNMPPWQITALIASFFAAQFLAGPTMGRWSDKYGRVPVLILSQIGTALSFFMMGWAYAPWVLFASRILDGITGGNIIVAQAYVTDITPKEERTKALGFIFAAFGLGFMFGPLVGGYLSAWFGSTFPFMVAGVAAALVTALTWFTLDETVTAEKTAEQLSAPDKGQLTWRDITQNSPLLITLIIAFVGQFALGLLQGTFALYSEAVLFEGYSAEDTKVGIGFLLMVVGVSQFLTQSLILPRLSKLFDEVTLIALGSIVRTMSMLVFAVISTPWLGGIGSLLFALGMGILMPPLQAYTTKLVADDQRAVVLGWFQSVVSLSTIFSLLAAGPLFEIAPTVPYWIGSALSFLMIFPVLLVLRQPAKEVLSAGA